MRKKLQQLMDERLNPAIESHGGFIEIADFVNHIVYVRMQGGCQGCASSADTLKHGVERIIRQVFPLVEEVRDMTHHSEGTNPYYHE